MRSRFIAVVVLLGSGLTMGSRVQGAVSTPTVGDWTFCTSESQVGCIEHFSFEDGGGVMRSYATLNEAQNAGISVTARCYASGASDGAPCVPPASMGCGSAGTNFQVSVNPTPFDENANPRDGSVFLDRRFVVRLRTGDFDPVFAMGGRIDATTRARLSSGLFTFEVEGRIQKSYSVSFSGVSMQPYETYRSRLSEFLGTSKATSVAYSAGVSVYPSSFLKSTSVDLNGLCVTMPFTDAFADANGMGFTTTWKPARPTDPLVSTIEMEVSGPHFLPDSNGNDDKFVPARIRFFLPDAFFTSAGYEDPSRFDASRMLITTRDGQKPVPTLTRKATGVLVDYGISHYSAPDPVLKLYRSGVSPAVDAVSVTTTTAPAPTTTLPTSAGSALRLSKGKAYTSSRLASAAGLKRPTGATVSLKVVPSSVRYCRVVGASVRGLKAGRCRVTVNVRLKGRTTAVKTLTITVV